MSKSESARARARVTIEAILSGRHENFTINTPGSKENGMIRAVAMIRRACPATESGDGPPSRAAPALGQPTLLGPFEAVASPAGENQKQFESEAATTIFSFFILFCFAFSSSRWL